MLSNIKHHFTFSILLLFGFTNYTFAQMNLPVSSQSSEGEKVEVVEEIKIQVQASTAPSNPALKQGDACSDENLEEAKGTLITVLPALPLAKTIPCTTDDCKDLKPAKLQSYIVKKLPPQAKTIKCSK